MSNPVEPFHEKLDETGRAEEIRSGWPVSARAFSIDCTKPGFILKENGVWNLTPEGESKFQLGDVGSLCGDDRISQLRRQNQPPEPDETGEMSLMRANKVRKRRIDEFEQLAIDGLKTRSRLGIRTNFKVSLWHFSEAWLLYTVRSSARKGWRDRHSRTPRPIRDRLRNE